jgi:hypothetical protein
VLRPGGADLASRAWHERDQRLRQLLSDAPDRIHAIDTLPATRACHDQLVELGFEGTVLKRHRSTYRQGRHSTWRKHKARRHIDVEVLGVRTDREGHRRAACLRVDDDRSFVALIHGRAIALQPQRGGEAVVTYSRVDADGGLREAWTPHNDERRPRAASAPNPPEGRWVVLGATTPRSEDQPEGQPQTEARHGQPHDGHEGRQQCYV